GWNQRGQCGRRPGGGANGVHVHSARGDQCAEGSQRGHQADCAEAVRAKLANHQCQHDEAATLGNEIGGNQAQVAWPESDGPATTHGTGSLTASGKRLPRHGAVSHRCRLTPAAKADPLYRKYSTCSGSARAAKVKLRSRRKKAYRRKLSSTMA